MVYIFFIVVILGLGWWLYRNNQQKQELNRRTDMELYQETDEFISKKKLFNQAQKPGELDNSVEKIYYPKKGRGQDGQNGSRQD